VLVVGAHGVRPQLADERHVLFVVARRELPLVLPVLMAVDAVKIERRPLSENPRRVEVEEAQLAARSCR
jgi:hypothetical protein